MKPVFTVIFNVRPFLLRKKQGLCGGERKSHRFINRKNHPGANYFLIAAVGLLLAGCKKDKDPDPQQPGGIAKIKSASNSQLNAFFEYDTEGRVIKEQSNSGSSNQVNSYAYSPGKVTITTINTGSSTSYDTIVLTLDPNGYVTKQTSKSLLMAGVTAINLGCNADGTLLFRSLVLTNGDVNRYEYVYNQQTGLLDSISNKLNGSWTGSTVIQSYDASKPYSLRSENVGRSFDGNQYGHPPVTGIFKEKVGNTITTITFNYTYEYDDRARIIKSVDTRSSGTTLTTTYTYY